jgi:hypothetical protein
MATKAARVTVTTSATRLDVPDTDSREGSTLVVRCSAAALFVGGADVTAATGYEIPAGDAVALDLSGNDVLYAVVATGSAVTHVLRAGV